MNLQNERILLGITGGIAAYKCAELTRLMVKAGAEVQVVMTPAAGAFITPLTLQALSGRDVRTSLLDESAELGMSHIELAKWATKVVIAPASADFIARYANGLGNDLLTTVMLAYEGPVFIAPAMNQAMYRHPATQRNLKLLRHSVEGLKLIGPACGEQACGDNGPGRMEEPATIVAALVTDQNTPLSGKQVVITAGPTREPLDPVRYISNHSSGKMGYALAAAALQAGAEVTLISGPVELNAPPGAALIKVGSALEMHAAAMQHAPGSDLFIATAAVADYRPRDISEHKIKKTTTGNTMELSLVHNPDIVADVAALNSGRPFVVGFAAETRDALAYGRDKLQRKNLDMVIINDISRPGLGFGSDRNQVCCVTQDQQTELGPEPKQQLSGRIINLISGLLT